MRLIKHLGSRGEEDPRTHNIEVARLPANVVGKDLDVIWDQSYLYAEMDFSSKKIVHYNTLRK